ncbi:sulfotransferase 2B1-like isoform X2 [Leuresthes tenuis]|uniref:sulfotransferase 2B1-like isoform X2 n=1 Tax=Leuresthes tenuis TaxID=355514 RepID=UPI003B509962
MTEAELYMPYKGVYLPSVIHSPESLKYYEEFTFRPDDIVTVTYPKSGTTWMKEIIPLITSGGDPKSVETLHNWDRVPFLEEVRAPILNLEERPSPRMFSTHFHYSMMPPSFFEVKPKSWLNADDKQSIMYISYEEMIMDLKDSVTRITQFLEKSLDAEVIEKIADRCLFENMKQNNMSNYSVVPREIMDQTKSEFFRKGIAGDWKNLLTASEAEYFDSVYKDKMKDVTYKFAWD